MTELLTYQNFEAGMEDFEKLITQKMVYVDKTSYLEDLLHRAVVTLLLRPRRFGKTLSMSMLSCFLEMNYQHPEDRSRPERLFKDLTIYKNKEFCDKYMGRYPVISITLKSIEGSDFAEAMKEMLSLLLELLNKYSFLQKSSKQEEGNKLSLKSMIRICSKRDFRLGNKDNMNAAIDIAKNAMKLLSDMLYAEYEKEAVIIIDEYDVPLQKAKVNGYYDKMLKVIKGMLGKALKSNNSLTKGFVTGCLRIAHQSIFTDINNFVCLGNSNDTQFAEFIGLTKDETARLLSQCGMESRLHDMVAWYDGYSFAGNAMLCPWSVLNFLYDALSPKNDRTTFKPQNYWTNSSGNDIIEICMRRPGARDTERIQNLLNMGTEYIEPCEFTSYPEITSATDFDTFATLMLHTGYLTVAEESRSKVPRTETAGQYPDEATDLVPVKIPNREVWDCFARKARLLFSRKNPEWDGMSQDLRENLFDGNAAKVSEIINKMLQSFISVRDTGKEDFYHDFITGVLGITSGSPKELKSNREAGNGYFDLAIMDDSISAAVIMEFKISESTKASVRIKECVEALDQIERNNYDCELKEKYDSIRKFGIVFFKKTCAVMEKSQLDKTSAS